MRSLEGGFEVRAGPRLSHPFLVCYVILVGGPLKVRLQSAPFSFGMTDSIENEALLSFFVCTLRNT